MSSPPPRSGEYFAGGETGMAVHGSACSALSVGISVDVNAYEPHVLAGSMAHMIGHNVGMGHDDKSEYIETLTWPTTTTRDLFRIIIIRRTFIIII